MKKNQKKTMRLLIAAVILLCVLQVCMGVLLLLLRTQQALVEGSHTFDLAPSLSEDGQFRLIPQRADDKTAAYATFIVERAEDQTLLFACPDRYRTLDLKAIRWEGSDVIVESGDLGMMVYYGTGWGSASSKTEPPMQTTEPPEYEYLLP